MTYSIWQRFITDGGEAVVAGATISVYLESSGEPATLYDGPSGSPIGSTTTSGIDGLAKFFAPAGTYKIVAAKGAFSTEFRHVQLGNSQSHDVGSGLDDVVIGSELLAKKDVLSFANFAAFPATGADATLYVAADTGLVYRWDGAAYAAAFGGGFYMYDTKAAANAAVGGMADLAIVEVLADESQSGARTRYRKESGSLVFKIALEQFLQSGAGAVPRTARAKLRDTVSVKDFGAMGDGVADDTAAIQAAINSGASKIEIPEGTYIFTNIIINPSLREFIGSGSASTDTYLKRKTGATGAGIAWNGSNRVTQAVIGHFRMDGNSEVAETYGIDLSGFSYCTFQNMWIRAFRMDGVYANGSITPVNKQFSNNTFVSVRSNNNLRDGWRFDGGAAANSANTYVGCEGAANAGIGFNELYGYSNQTVGCTFQGNTIRDFYTNGSRNKHDFYAEGSPKPVELGAASFGNQFSARSSYPLWNTFVDAGTQNIVSIRGEVEPERHIFNNPFFLNWTLSVPKNIALNGSPTLSSFSDANSPANAGVQATVNANFQGLVFSLSETKENLQGKWVTLILEIDTSGVVDTLNSRVVARDGATDNPATGEFSTENLPVSASGTFVRLAYDVKFAASVSGTPTILWYMAYSGVSGSNVIKIRSARILMGQTRKASQYIGVEAQHSTSTTALGGATNGINTHRKYAGRLVYETSTGKLRFAVGELPTSAWRATDGTGDLTPT